MKRAAISLTLLLGACLTLEPPSGDIIPPTVVEFQPSGDEVPLGARVGVRFSEPVDPSAAELAVLVTSEVADDYFISDFDSPPLSKTRAGLVVPCDARLGQKGDMLFLTPDDLLAPGTGYSVVVSAAVCDRVGNPLVDDAGVDERGRIIGRQTHFVHEFSTRAGEGEPDPDPDPEPDPDPDPQPVVGPIFTEVMANPAGSEAAGEYLEILHLGAAPVDLAGCRLDDQGGQGTGDLLAPCESQQSSLLQPGQLALLVGQDFIPPPDLLPQTLLMCTDRTTLTPRGLKNSGGEELVLIDGLDNEVCRYGGWLDLSSPEDCSATRLDPNAPDSPDNWTIMEETPCRTPGWLEE